MRECECGQIISNNRAYCRQCNESILTGEE